MARVCARIAGVLALAVFLVSAARAADLKDPKEIIRKSQEKVMSLDSYGYTIVAEGWERNTKELQQRTKSVAGEASGRFGSAAKGAAKEVETDPAKPRYMKYNVTMKYMKPFYLQMNLTRSDYVPKIMYGSVLTYRPEDDPKVFWFKLRSSPIALKREITSESGNFLYSSWHIQYIQMDQLRRDARPALQGVRKVNGRDAYVIAFNFPGKKKAREHPVNYDQWGIPKEARFRFEREAPYYAENDVGKVVYFIDKETLLPLATENYDRAGQKNYHKEWRDVKVNTLSKSDF